MLVRAHQVASRIYFCPYGAGVSPSYGRGPGGEMWKLEDKLFELVSACMQILSDDPVFFLINSYTTGLGATVLKNMLELTMVPRFGGSVMADEVGLPVAERGLVLPCGTSGRWQK